MPSLGEIFQVMGGALAGDPSRYQKFKDAMADRQAETELRRKHGMLYDLQLQQAKQAQAQQNRPIKSLFVPEMGPKEGFDVGTGESFMGSGPTGRDIPSPNATVGDIPTLSAYAALMKKEVTPWNVNRSGTLASRTDQYGNLQTQPIPGSTTNEVDWNYGFAGDEHIPVRHKKGAFQYNTGQGWVDLSPSPQPQSPAQTSVPIQSAPSVQPSSVSGSPLPPYFPMPGEPDQPIDPALIKETQVSPGMAPQISNVPVPSPQPTTTPNVTAPEVTPPVVTSPLPPGIPSQTPGLPWGKKATGEASTQEKGLTEKGVTVYWDPKKRETRGSYYDPTQKKFVDEPYEKSKHGQIQQTAQPFSTMPNIVLNMAEAKKTGEMTAQEKRAKGMVTEAKAKEAYDYMKKTGALPPEILRLGFGDMGKFVMEEYKNKMLTLAEKDGWTGADRAFSQAQYKGFQTQITTNARMETLNRRYESMLQQNTSALEQESIQYLRSKYPDFNTIKNMISKKTGDPNIVAFQAQLGRVAVEWAKISAGALGLSEPSVEAQKKMNEILSSSNNWEQLQANIQTIRMDAAHNAASFNMQNQRISDEFFGGQKPSVEAPPLVDVKVRIGNMDIITQMPEDSVNMWKGTTIKGQAPTATKNRLPITGGMVVPPGSPNPNARPLPVF